MITSNRAASTVLFFRVLLSSERSNCFLTSSGASAIVAAGSTARAIAICGRSMGHDRTASACRRWCASWAGPGSSPIVGSERRARHRCSRSRNHTTWQPPGRHRHPGFMPLGNALPPVEATSRVDIHIRQGRPIASTRATYISASAMPAQRRGLAQFTAASDNREATSSLANASSDLSARHSSSQDTIFALSTGNSGPAGVAVVRISGPQAAQVLEALTSGTMASTGSAMTAGVVEASLEGDRAGPKLPAPRRAVVRRLYDPAGGDLLDEALVLWMPGPRSFTGEDTVELHTHGSRAVINGVLDALSGMREAGVRMAERGEFTQRAYGNGRMDLTGVEGLADLIAADTAAQRKQALRQMGGALRDMYEGWRTQLKGCLAHAEAVIDFGDDEEDVGGDAAFAAMMPRVSNLAADIEAHLSDGGRGEIVRSGIKVAIVGPPNAGKSSLLNLLASRPAAIVSPIAGTTRDVVEVQMDIAGLPVTLSDTAGLREVTDDEIEKEGMRRARSAVNDAHLAIFVVDVTQAKGASELLTRLREEASGAACLAGETDNGTDDFGGGGGGGGKALEDVIVVANKADLDCDGGEHHLNALVESATVRGLREAESGAEVMGIRGPVWRISCKTKDGLDGLVEHLEEAVRSRFQVAADSESPLITRRRHRQHVEACLEALREAQRPRLALDLAAEELRIASTELGRITGAVDVEELLDVIFRDFCIGK